MDVASERILSVGNFDSLPLAAALDFLRIALAPVLTSANERMVKLLQAPLSGLPEGLSPRPGIAEDRSTFLVVPLHRELKKGTLNGLLKDAGLEREELRRLL